MNRQQRAPSQTAAFQVVARRPGKPAPKENFGQNQSPNMHFHWKNFERMGKSAGFVISLLSLCGILFAAGSKIQRVLDDLAALHRQVENHEDRLQQNEANDSRQAVEVGYLRGKLEHNSDPEQKSPEARVALHPRGAREESVHARGSFRFNQKSSSSNPSSHAVSNAPAIGDKLYTTILYYYRQALRHQPNLAGQLTVICRVDQTGSLAATEIIATSPELTGLAERLTKEIRRWKFPEHVTGLESGSFHKTYFLSPQGF